VATQARKEDSMEKLLLSATSTRSARSRRRSYVAGLALAVVAFAGARRADACSTDVHAHSSPANVMHSPHVHNVFWGASYWNAAGNLRSELDATWTDLANNVAFWKRLAEYGVGNGNFADSTIQDPPVVQGSGIYVSEQDIQGTIAAEVEAGNIAGGFDGNDLYVIYLEPAVYSDYDNTNNFAGHHMSFTDSIGRLIRYAVVEWGSSAQMTMLSSHEIAEAATDPDSNGYFQDSDGDEIGDLCQAGPGFLWDGHQVEEVWSQDACSCIQITPPDPNPCDKLPPEEKLCCLKPWLPVCNPRGGGL
jgi:hypothetical protein